MEAFDPTKLLFDKEQWSFYDVYYNPARNIKITFGSKSRIIPGDVWMIYLYQGKWKRVWCGEIDTMEFGKKLLEKAR